MGHTPNCGSLYPTRYDEYADALGHDPRWGGSTSGRIGSHEYLGSTRWIRLAGAAGYTLYSLPDAAHPNLEQPPPPVGLGLAATDLEELSSLVNNRTPVTIVD